MSYASTGTRMRRHLLSMILTLIPALVSAFDAKSPAGPAPITRTSTSVSWVSIAGNREESRKKWLYVILGFIIEVKSGLSLGSWKPVPLEEMYHTTRNWGSREDPFQTWKAIPRVSQVMRSEKSHQRTYMHGHPSSRGYSRQRFLVLLSSFIYPKSTMMDSGKHWRIIRHFKNYLRGECMVDKSRGTP